MHQQSDTNLAILQLHEHVMISLQRVCESICFGSAALHHHQPIRPLASAAEYAGTDKAAVQAHLEILATHQACIDIDRTKGHYTALLKIKVQVLHDQASTFRNQT